jgi:Family of unknown function (DUF5681)
MKSRKKRSPANRRKAGGDGHPIVELGKGTRFQPGQSGNPNGKPKWRLLSDTYRAKLAELETTEVGRGGRWFRRC